jgi:antirestriction protein ArdC
MSTDLYAATTDRIIAALEQGVAPWVRLWSTGIDTLPMNAGSKRAYRGINVVLLALEAQRYGYPRNGWLTYRQASELGGQVRKGEQGCPVASRFLRE